MHFGKRLLRCYVAHYFSIWNMAKGSLSNEYNGGLSSIAGLDPEFSAFVYGIKDACSRDLIDAVCRESEEDIIRLLKYRCKNNGHVIETNETALSMACRRGKKWIIQLLLQHGADPNVGTSPLIEAYNAEHMDVVDWLLDQGFDPNQTDNRGDTLLLSALRTSPGTKTKSTHFKQLIKMLRKRYVNVNITDCYGIPVLHLAAVQMLKAPFLISYLLENEANLTNRDAFGQTILYRLCDAFYQFHEFLKTSKSLVNLAIPAATLYTY